MDKYAFDEADELFDEFISLLSDIYSEQYKQYEDALDYVQEHQYHGSTKLREAVERADRIMRSINDPNY